MLSLTEIEYYMCKHEAAFLPQPDSVQDRACVALILSGRSNDLHISFILRSARPEDPWSGQMALPGGRASADDLDNLNVAIRETREEIGIDLHRDQCLGRLSQLQIGAHSSIPAGVLSPFVFYHGAELPVFCLQISEVAAGFWIPVKHLWSATNWTTTRWQDDAYPGILYQNQLIWGLTLRVLDEFADAIEVPFPNLNQSI